MQLDILAPAATQHHVTAGGEWRFDRDWAVELAAMYAPEASVTGVEVSGDHIVEVSTEQYEITLGIKYFYDSP